jgi:cell division protein FtsQ
VHRVAKPRRGTALITSPTFRWVAAAVGLVGIATGVYLAALETSIFAVRTIDVAAGSPRVKAEVRRALEPELGRSLLRLDESALTRRLEALPDVVSARFDRSFPSTLRVTVRAERAVLLVRQGASSWVVSARGRVMRRIASPRRSSLPRLWVRKSVKLSVGETLPAADGRLAAAAVAPIARRAYPGGVRSVISGNEALTLVLGEGTEVRLGDIGDLRLKLTIARRILRLAAGDGASTPAYVDVSVPERPVLGAQ